MNLPHFVEGEVRLIGHRWSPRVHELKDFLARSRLRYRWFDIEGDAVRAKAILERTGVEEGRFPVVLLPDGSMLIDPELSTLAGKLGLGTEPDVRDYDLIIVGGGPAGLTSSIYTASDGLRTIVVEQGAAGGQASYSENIENYPGFPDGLSGIEFARRTVLQAERFGVEVIVTRQATGLKVNGKGLAVALDDGSELRATSVLLATGASFRWLDAPGCPSLVGAGIYYGEATSEATACRDQDVYVLGSGNSAGQAALLLARFARRVVLVALEESLEETMSEYLIPRIQSTENIVVKTGHTIVGAEGSGHLEWLTLENVKTGETERVKAASLFVFIGATPRTEWLGDTVSRDEQGFVHSGFDYMQDCKPPDGWPLERSPYPLETSVPGVFVAGDARKGSVKRLTSATGEGAMAAQMIYRYCTDPDAR
jgi:thioredoxin reductase (NADPH)